MSEPSPVRRVWVVTWERHVQGVFSSALAADEYVDHRWPRRECRYGVRITDFMLDVGWDPA